MKHSLIRAVFLIKVINLFVSPGSSTEIVVEVDSEGCSTNDSATWEYTVNCPGLFWVGWGHYGGAFKCLADEPLGLVQNSGNN